MGDVPLGPQAAHDPDAPMKILKRRHPHPEIPLVSTADVSFLLLIFFLSTTIFVTQRGISLELPGPADRPLLLEPSTLIHVRVEGDRSVRVDGEVVSPDGLGRTLRERLRAKPGLVVRLTIDPAAPYSAMVQTLDQVKLSGARQISLQKSGDG
jgi:biopolymer transport protein ExbD